LKGSLRHSQEFSTSTKTPSLTGHESDVKARLNRAWRCAKSRVSLQGFLEG